MIDPAARSCRFARAVTAEVGTRDDSFLRRLQPLGSAHVLNAFGQGMADLSGGPACLRLDSGLISRLLRALELEGL